MNQLSFGTAAPEELPDEPTAYAIAVGNESASAMTPAFIDHKGAGQDA